MSGLDDVFNISRGKVNAYYERVATNDPANSAIVVVLMQTIEADATIADYDSLGALLVPAGNVQADFTNYARKILTDADITNPSPDDTNNWQSSTIGVQTWTSAGGATNNTLVKALLCYDPDTASGDDTSIIPLTYHSFDATTNGNNLVMNINASGTYRASA